MQSKYCALSVRGWEVASRRRSFFRGTMLRPLPHMRDILLKHFLFVVCFFAIQRKGGAFFNMKIRKISLAGLLVAISIIFSRFLAADVIVGGLSTLRISLGPVPIYLSGMLLGPVYGGIVGVLADSLGYLVKPLGGYFPGFAINGAITGMIPGLLVMFYKKKESWWRLFFIITIVETITSAMLTPLWLSMMTGKAFIVFLPSNLISRALLIPIYVTLVKTLLTLTKQTIPSLG